MAISVNSVYSLLSEGVEQSRGEDIGLPDTLQVKIEFIFMK
jgi:hypothetical protein